ncbi:MAG: BlaI/MecI/CopY family transcriptional regulator [Saprospiraceae bacterium]|nr:BlaI/MecI/CopY family transcriptional regulator [Saprospiraceae bacterium]
MKIKPTDSELEILQLLWQLGPCSVREVNEILNERREVGYTTTLKLMQIMNEKGITERDTSGKTHIYSAIIHESDTKNTLLTDFINAAFHGSAMSLVMQALGNTKTSQEELDELKSLIKTLENN